MTFMLDHDHILHSYSSYQVVIILINSGVVF